MLAQIVGNETVIQWNNARRYSFGAVSGDVLNFQIRLNNVTKAISIVYGTCTATSTTALTCQVGLRGATNSDFNNRTSATNWATTSAGGTNAVTVTSSNTIMPASGLTFTWAPPSPDISYTALANTCSTTARTLTATISDADGVPTAGAGLPVLYWRIGAGAYTAATGTSIGGDQYSFSFGAGVVAGNVVSYYIVAQDVLGNVNAAPRPGTGGYTSSPPASATPPSTPSSYTIQSSLAAGTYSIPGSFATLTAAVAAYNSSCLGGPIVFELAAAYPGAAETFPIVIQNNADASATNTLTIRPAAGQVKTITGSNAFALIHLNGADHVTINGSNNPQANSCCGPTVASTRDLTINNTNTGTASAVTWISSLSGNTATNNSIRNCILIGASSTTTRAGSGIGGATVLSVAGAPATNTTFENNDIRRSKYGIYCLGASLAAMNTGTVISQNLINTPTPAHVGDIGVVAGFEDGIQITCNTIAELIAASTTDVIGISLGAIGVVNTTNVATEVYNATVSRNRIDNLTAASTYSVMGIWAGGVNTGTTTIANNMISRLNGNGTSGDYTAAIFAGGVAGGTTDIFYNTVDMAKSLTGGSYPSFALALGGTGTNTVNVRNNIFTSTGSSGANLNRAVGLMWALPANNVVMDNNDLFVSGTGAAVGQTGNLSNAGTNHVTLANWQGASGKDANSKNVAPVYSAYPDLHLNVTNPSNIANLYSAGSAVSVTSDIDCTTRSSTPTIGAHEIVLPLCTGAPSAGSSSGPTSACAGDLNAYTNNANNAFAGIAYTWYASLSSASGPWSIAPGTGANAQNYTTDALIAGTHYLVLSAKCTNTGDSALSNVITLLVNPSPIATVTPSGPTAFCGSGTLVASSATSYLWAPGGAVTPSINVTTNGDYSVTVTDANGCMATSATVSVTVNPQPGPVSITPSTPSPICAGSSIGLVASGGLVTGTVTQTSGTISVSIPDANATGINNAFAVSGIPAGATIDSVIVTMSITHSFVQDLVVNLEAPNGQIINLAGGVAGATGSAYTGTRITSNDAAPALLGSTTGHAGTYRADKRTSAFQLTPTVPPTTALWSNLYSAPNGTWRIRVIDDESIGSGTLTNWQIKIAYSIPVSFSWDPTDDLTPTTGASVSASPAMTTLYTVTATATGGCTSTADVTVSVQAAPNAGSSTTLAVCASSTTNNLFAALGGTPDAGGSWSPSGPNYNAVTMNPGAFTYTVAPTAPCTVPATATVTVSETTPNVSLDVTLTTLGTLPTYELRDAVSTALVQSGGGGVGNQGTSSLAACLANGNYSLTMNGVPAGARYVLRTAGNPGTRLIDNRVATVGTNQVTEFTATPAALSSNGTVQLPVGPTELLYTSCDKYFWKKGEFIVVNEDADVAAVWIANGSNAVQSATTGYDFWFYDPNGGYSFIRQRRHNVSDGFGNVGSSRTCHMQVNSWTAANWIPNQVPLNVRVRAVVNNVPKNWGPACRFMRDDVLALCPPTKLMDVPGNPFISCNVTRAFNNQSINRLYARPITGATKYKFTFNNAELMNPIVREVTTYYLTLGWNSGVAPILQNTQTYDVTVQAFVNGAYCVVGEVCSVTICNNPPCMMNGGGQQNSAIDAPTDAVLNMYPNPNNGDQLYISLSAVEEGVNTVSMDLYDVSGKRMIARTIAAQDGFVNTVVDLNGDLAAGMYMVNIIAGDRVYTQRLVIQP
ncbi:MAG: T9SS type A sorting domain-containing protein [Flavobacteriales bacterium]|nr:T9SS type A sorting domain-containing protein [Flavobacteriales bacterium]